MPAISRRDRRDSAVPASAGDGKIVSESYGRLTSIALDPIEKKPLSDFMPGTTVLSIGSYGCNLRCPFCQNWQISQTGEGGVPWKEVSPIELVASAQGLKAEDPFVSGIAYTYNEPLVGWEYVRDCSVLAHQTGLKNILVSNGCANEPIIRELAPLIDAANIDLKGPDQKFYDDCAGDFAAVQKSIEILAATPTCHLEITTLIVPGMNDKDEDVESIAKWLSEIPTAGDPITLHITRFFPRWHMNTGEPTPVETIYHLADVAKKYLDRVRCGNV
jgi:pyruvate formate lyase activating enzyme